MLLLAVGSNAQIKIDDFGRIILNTYLPDSIPLPAEAKSQLRTKLSQIASNNGMGGSDANPRFIITANVLIGTKDIIAGPPQMIAQNIEIVLFVGDAISNTIFANTTLSLKGVGINENKAFIEAFKSINPRNKAITDFLTESKNKIVNYYSTNCDFLIKGAQVLVMQKKYDEAIYQLSLVPDVCSDCYFKCLDALALIYQQKIDADCKVKFNEAKTIWAASQTPNGAEKAGDILSSINPFATCQSEINTFIKSIDAKIRADEKARWNFKMKQYTDKIAMEKEKIRIAEEKSKRDDIYRENQSQRNAVIQEKQFQRNYELDKIRVSAYRDVAIEYIKNQSQKVTYNKIYWR